MKKHDRNSFYKYYSAKTLKRILKTKRFRWSSPIVFNDPFDNLYEISLEDNMEGLRNWFIAEALNFVFDEVEPVIEFPNLYTKQMLELRKIRHGLNREKIESWLNMAFKESIERADKFLSSINDKWKKMALKQRIFCVSENPLNLLMWAHYANNHTGAVLEIGCIEDLDSQLCAATKVEYRKRMPKLGSYKNGLLSFLGRLPEQTNPNLYLDLAYVKSEDWSYEGEWRCILDSNKKRPVSDWKYWPKEILAVYFGCRMKEKDKIQVSKLLKNDLSHVKMFEMEIDKSEYRISPKEFRRDNENGIGEKLIRGWKWIKNPF